MSTASASPAPAATANTPEEIAREKGGLRRVLIIAIVAVAAIGGFTVWRSATRDLQSTDDAQVEADVVPLAVRVGGVVARVAVLDNTAVKKGDVLAVLDPTDLQARVKQAEGELAAARAQAAAADAQAQVTEAGARGGLSTARAQVSTSKAQVSSAEAQVASAQAQVVRAESEVRRTSMDLERQKQLKAANAVPQERVDNAQAAADGAQAQLTAAQAQLSAAHETKNAAQSRVAEATGLVDTNAPVDAKVAGARASADLAHARVTTAEAALELVKLNLSYATVTAPIDGVVSKLTVREGQLVSPGQVLASVVPAHTYVVANFKETQVGHMKPGQRVEVTLDAFEGQTLQGKVESLSGGTGSRFSMLPPDNASGNFVKVVQRVPVRIAWDGLPPGLTVRPGLSANVTVRTGE